ncbi:Crp/Fnr family transcriptional regulator [Rossellomorea aquimaris]|uniref:Crp/Fnr family transcriptional regulator n=1 Tax=Rossellomorea aquimaris TaxID=189382 RepID=UPI0007D0626F|nr:Crp/Fnr family transcriptional regulator [Rossellomorea aquimaris]
MNTVASFEVYDEFSLRNVPTSVFRYKKKEIIFQPFTLSKNLYFVQNGSVKMYKYNEDGRKTILALIGKGGVFSNISPFTLDDEGVYAKVMDDTILYGISHKQLDQLSVTQPSIFTTLYSNINEHIKDRNVFLEKIMYASVKERILHLFSHLVPQFGERQGNGIKINVSLTHQDIACFIGSTRETVTSLTKELLSEGHIQKKKRIYHLCL